MTDLQRQKNELIDLTPTQLHPRDARAEDFEIGSVSRTDAEREEALRDSDAVRESQKQK